MDTWLKITLFLVSIGVSIFVFDVIIRKIFGVTSKQAHQYVNETHKKIDWSIRSITIVF